MLHSLAHKRSVLLALLLALAAFSSASGSWISALVLSPAPTVMSVSASPSVILGGQTATGTVVISEAAPLGGQVVDVTANVPVTVPSTVTVPEGDTSATFTITGLEHRIPRTGVIAAGISGGWQTTAITVRPSALNISVTPTQMTGGGSASVTVSLGNPAPLGGAVVALEADRGVTLPSTVTIPEGSSSATVSASTPSVPVSTTATIYARRNGVISWAGLLLFPPRIASITLSPSTVDAGDTITGTITLDAPASGAGLPVFLSSNRPQVTVPGTAFVPPGQTSVTFPVGASASPSEVKATIIGAANGFRKFAVLTVRPLILSTLTLQSQGAPVTGRVRGTVTLSGVAPVTLNVNLSSTPSGLVHPPTVSIPAGQRSNTFEIFVPPTPNTTRAHTIYANFFGVIRSAGLNVYMNAPLSSPQQSLAGLSGWGSVAYSESASSRSIPAKVVAGPGGIVILRQDGSVEGQGAISSDRSAAVPQNVSGIRDVSIGYGHTLYAMADGTVVGRGDNSTGQLTNSVTGAIKVAAGGGHSLALRSDGTVEAWGLNDDGQATVPSGLTGVIAIAAGELHSLALKSDGTVVSWGDDSSGQVTLPSFAFPVIEIAAGANHSLARMSNGIVVGWGLNSFGQATPPPFPVAKIAARGNSSLAWRGGSTFEGWGDGSSGQFSVPPNSRPVISLALGSNMGAYVLDGGQVASWGAGAMRFQKSMPNAGAIIQADGGNGWLAALDAQGFVNVFGRQATTPALPGVLGGISQVSAGAGHGAALQAGNIILWGSNTDGQATLPGGVVPASSVVAFGNNTAAIRANRTVAVWGANASNQTTVPFGTIQVVQLVGGLGNTATEGFVVALRSSGVVTAWGDNSFGQTSIPGGLSNVVKLAAKFRHVLALKSDGTVVAWGANTSGEATVPMGLTDVVDIAAGNSWSAALKSDGTIVTWGSDPFGVRTSAPGSQRFSAIAAGAQNLIGLNRGAVLARVPGFGHNQGGLVDLTLPVPPTTNTTVSLTANPSLVTVPATVLVRAGQRSVQFAAVSTGGFHGPVRIDATVGGQTMSGSIIVADSAPVITSLALSPSTVNTGSTFDLTMTLDKPAPSGGTSISIWTNQPTFVNVPPSVLVPAGQTTYTVTCSTNGATLDVATTVFAGNSRGTRSAVLNVMAPKPQSVTPAALAVPGGASSSFDILLNMPASVAGSTVEFWTSRPEITLPYSTVFFGFGEDLKTVPFTTAPVTVNTPVTIYARVNGRTRFATVTLTP